MTLPRLDGSAVPMSHLTPMWPQRCGREVTRAEISHGMTGDTVTQMAREPPQKPAKTRR